jgi:DNA helicase II / ATP-dependent DNA helicase PcrA
VLSKISHAKNTKQGPPDLYKAAVNKESEAVAAVFEEYEKALRTANALDFDDLLLEAVRLLRHDDATREAWNRRLTYLMVDEYQDTNRSQYELMRLLSEQQNNVCVVGDEDQSIYSWRGADIRNILDFERDFGSAKIIRLEQNYRSTKNILGAAGAVVENNKERKGKKLWTDAAAGDKLGCMPVSTPKTRRSSSPTPSRNTWQRIPPITWRCCTAPISNRGRSKKRCAATGGATAWWAASAFISAPKSKIPWRT